MPSPPNVRVLVVCATVLQDLGTGRITLESLLEVLYSPEFPAAHAGLVVYARMSGLNGEYGMSVRVTAPDLETSVADVEAPAPLVVTDPLETVNVVFPLPELDFPVAGRYSVRLLYNGRIAQEIPLLAEEGT